MSCSIAKAKTRFPFQKNNVPTANSINHFIQTVSKQSTNTTTKFPNQDQLQLKFAIFDSLEYLLLSDMDSIHCKWYGLQV